MAEPRTAAYALVESLKAQGVDTLFCVPGESYLAVLDALYEDPAVRVIVCRQEGGAAFMASAHAKLTGKPGVVFVTRGPGACNASVGVHTAQQDSTPLILFVGQVGRPDVGREAFQEIDLGAVFGSMTKWSGSIDRADRVPELISRAFHTATAGRPGPVVLGLPEDMLSELTAAPVLGPSRRVEPHASGADLIRVRSMLSQAERPFVLVGGGGWSEGAKADLEAFLSANRLPVGTAFRRADYIDNDHSGYAGDVGIGINPALAERIKSADLLLVIGARLAEMTTGGYDLVSAPRPRQSLIHVHSSAEELGRVYRPAIAINASSKSFAAALRGLPPVDSTRWAPATFEAHADYLVWQEPRRGPGNVQMGEIVAWLRNRLPADTIITNGAGNYSGWVHRYYRFRRYPAQLAPTSGTMGYGVPAAVAAKLAYPDRLVVSFNGDGCFLMNGQELATAARYGLAIVFLVVNNGMYGTIRMHQERSYPGRVSATGLTNPDFASLVQAYGGHGDVVTSTEQFVPAFERAAAAKGPALIELRIDPEAITTQSTLSNLRAEALAARKA